MKVSLPRALSKRSLGLFNMNTITEQFFINLISPSPQEQMFFKEELKQLKWILDLVKIFISATILIIFFVYVQL